MISSLARLQPRQLFSGCRSHSLLSSSSKIYKRVAGNSLLQRHAGVCSTWSSSSKYHFNYVVNKSIQRQCTTPRISSPFVSRCMSSNTNSSNNKESPAKSKPPRKVTTLSIAAKKRRGQKITMVTAYDYPSAVHVDRAGIDIVLVGDSCAMVELGFETTQVC